MVKGGITSSKAPFDAAKFLLTPSIDEMNVNTEVDALRDLMEASDLYIENPCFEDYYTDEVLHHFLIARNYDVKRSFTMLSSAMKWRSKRNPDRWFKPVLNKKDLDDMERECCTGKIRLEGHDIYSREVIVFDNTVQNTKGSEGQLNFLAWNLEMAIKTMPKNVVDKYVIFMQLENFSILNSPPLSTTKETILMLTTCFPERLGHCVLFHPPRYFHIVFSMIKGFVDKRTLDKLVIIDGDISAGSKNDLKMTEIIGKKWKTITRVESDRIHPNCSPGYFHEAYWPWVLLRMEAVGKLLTNPTMSPDAFQMKLFHRVNYNDASDYHGNYPTELDSIEALKHELNPAKEKFKNLEQSRVMQVDGSDNEINLNVGSELLKSKYTTHSDKSLHARLTRVVVNFYIHLEGIVENLVEASSAFNDAKVFTVPLYVFIPIVCGAIFLCYLTVRFSSVCIRAVKSSMITITSNVMCLCDTSLMCQYRLMSRVRIEILHFITRFLYVILYCMPPLAVIKFMQIYMEERDIKQDFMTNMAKAVSAKVKGQRNAIEESLGASLGKGLHTTKSNREMGPLSIKGKGEHKKSTGLKGLFTGNKHKDSAPKSPVRPKSSHSDQNYNEHHYECKLEPGKMTIEVDSSLPPSPKRKPRLHAMPKSPFVSAKHKPDKSKGKGYI